MTEAGSGPRPRDDDSAIGQPGSAGAGHRIHPCRRRGRCRRVAASLPTDPDCANGFFVPPTVLEVPDIAVVAREEIFGPVMSMVRFTDTKDVLRMANRQSIRPRGRAVDVRSGSRPDRRTHDQGGHRMGQRLTDHPGAGPVGRLQAVGHGRELGPRRLEDYLEAKHIYLNHA
jgi:acyl-CoA reductase-like NAD-dependent aldehyde dehydrogenase